MRIMQSRPIGADKGKELWGPLLTLKLFLEL